MGTSRTPPAEEIAPAASQSLPMLLLRLREIILLDLRPAIRSFDITEQQARVLIFLREAGAVEMGTLAEACSIHPPSLSRIVPRLRARGWLERQTPTFDQRRSVLSLSVEGRGVAEALRDALSRAYVAATVQISDERVRTLTTELRAAIAALGDPPVMTGRLAADGGDGDGGA